MVDSCPTASGNGSDNSRPSRVGDCLTATHSNQGFALCADKIHEQQVALGGRGEIKAGFIKHLKLDWPWQ